MYVKKAVKQLDYQNAISILSNTSGRFFLTIMIVVLYISASNGQNQNNIEVFTISVFYIQQLIACAKYVIQGGNMYQTYKVSEDRLENYLSMPKEQYGEELLENVESIRMQEVSFSYGEKEILKKRSGEFRKGHSYAVVGSNGSGKSTMLLVLLGILQKQSGEIIWNKQSLDKLNLEELRKHNIGFVNQEPMLMNDTIYNNLFYGWEGERLSENALEQYSMLDFVKEQEQGFDTMINAQSNNLSGGQKQRVSIVRALLRPSDVLIFDEPTSALDAEGAKQFVEMLQKEKKNRIIFVVTHDEAVIEACDERIQL